MAKTKAFPLRGDACRWQAFIADRTEGETGGLRSNSDEVKIVGNDLCVIPRNATQGVPYNTSPPPTAEPLLKEKPLKNCI